MSGPALALDDLRREGFDALVARLRAGPKAPWPGGVWRGTWLMPWPARPLSSLVVNRALFDAMPYGLDLDDGAWWFVRPTLRVARFAVSQGPSRFLDGAPIVRLTYGRSRLPRAVRAILYDEVQPLTPELILGLGAIDRPVGVGERFLFALRRCR